MIRVRDQDGRLIGTVKRRARGRWAVRALSGVVLFEEPTPEGARYWTLAAFALPPLFETAPPFIHDDGEDPQW